MTSHEAPRNILPLVTTVASAIEDLLQGGLTAASGTAVAILDHAFQEAARARLFQLAVCSRIAAEEMALAQWPNSRFSQERLHGALSRAWILARAIENAIEDGKNPDLANLFSAGSSKERCERMEAVALGVIPRVVAGLHVAFEFRLRPLSGLPLSPCPSLSWQCVLPFRKDTDVPLEAYLFMPQKQRFAPALFLEKKRLVFTQITISRDAMGSARISLEEKSTVSAGPPPENWPALCTWDPGAALSRLSRYRPSPLDLDTDPQEEVFLRNWEARSTGERQPGMIDFLISVGSVQLHAVVPKGWGEGVLLKALGGEASARPVLFGLMHYEYGSLVLQPVSLISEDGPVPLLIDPAKLDRKLLLKSLKF